MLAHGFLKLDSARFWSLVIVVKNGMVSRLAGGIGLHSAPNLQSSRQLITSVNWSSFLW